MISVSTHLLPSILLCQCGSYEGLQERCRLECHTRASGLLSLGRMRQARPQRSFRIQIDFAPMTTHFKNAINSLLAPRSDSPPLSTNNHILKHHCLSFIIIQHIRSTIPPATMIPAMLQLLFGMLLLSVTGVVAQTNLSIPSSQSPLNTSNLAYGILTVLDSLHRRLLAPRPHRVRLHRQETRD